MQDDDRVLPFIDVAASQTLPRTRHSSIELLIDLRACFGEVLAIFTRRLLVAGGQGGCHDNGM